MAAAGALKSVTVFALHEYLGELKVNYTVSIAHLHKHGFIKLTECDAKTFQELEQSGVTLYVESLKSISQVWVEMKVRGSGGNYPSYVLSSLLNRTFMVCTNVVGDWKKVKSSNPAEAPAHPPPPPLRKLINRDIGW